MSEQLHDVAREIVEELGRHHLELPTRAMQRFTRVVGNHRDATTIGTHLIVIAMRFIEQDTDTAADQMISLAAAALGERAMQRLVSAGVDRDRALRVVNNAQRNPMGSGLAVPNAGVGLRGKKT